jgi:hypothetical protein
MTKSVQFIDELTLSTVRSIVAASQRSPVIVVMSDHGLRNDLQDHEEMFRSLFLARTPGSEGVFPNDTTPINLIPRLLNAYVDANLPLASEDSYWLDNDASESSSLTPIHPDGDSD